MVLVEQLTSSEPLHRRLSDRLKQRLVVREWEAGGKLPSETQLAGEYGVSRATVRTAIKLLEAQGLVESRHGSGTYVTSLGPAIRAGLQDLRSMTATIAQLGHEPGMEYRSCTIRGATVEEARHLGIAASARVLAIERAVLSDDEIVAFSHDAIPESLLPPGFDPETMHGSVFDRMDDLGIGAVQAVAEVHAVKSRRIGWGPARPTNGLFLLLAQTHYGRGGVRVAYSRTYFVEGRFQFVIVRKR